MASPHPIYTIPNALSLYRIVSLPPIFFCFHVQSFLTAALLIFLALISDFFDGRIARYYNQETYLGALLDPIADKVFELSLLTYFYQHSEINGAYLVLFWLRNVSQLLSIPILMWWKKIHFKVKPSIIAKWGSALPSLIIIIIALSFYADQPWQKHATIIMVLVSTLIEIFMLATYLPRFIAIYRGEHDTFV